MASRKRTCSETNALSFLMKSAKKSYNNNNSRRKTNVRFVKCPAGCGKHIAEASMNVHLDKCIVELEAKGEGSAATVMITQASQVEPNMETNEYDDVDVETRMETNSTDLLDCIQTAETNTVRVELLSPEQHAPSPKSQQKDDSQQCTDTDWDDPSLVATSAATKESCVHVLSSEPKLPVAANAFSHMMANSRRAFSQSDKSQAAALVQQYFYLDESGTISLGVYANMHHRVAWSSSVILKNKMLDTDEPTTTTVQKQRSIELTVATALPSHSSPLRLVRRHSRLSVPVLKSILQKAIRRRQPLPAVRVAMELADKALGELLRRLSIIMLEDATLHPDHAFLLWLMMAHSKGYQASPQLVRRVMTIVFEIASCPWLDSCETDDPEPATIVPPTSRLDLSLLHTSMWCEKLTETGQAYIWSMLARAEYGGMKGDVRMLHEFARVWHARLETGGAVNAKVRERLLGSTSNTPTTTWEQIPFCIYEKAREQSLLRVPDLCARGMDRLALVDITLEGIDFHCSPVLSHLLSDVQMTGLCLDLLLLSKPPQEIPATREDKLTWLESIFKTCMWQYSSGVNHRQPLVPTPDAKQQKSKEYSALWNELASYEAKKFQLAYVQQRLA